MTKPAAEVAREFVGEHYGRLIYADPAYMSAAIAALLTTYADSREALEREECARVADQYIGYRSLVGPQHGAGVEHAARNIASTIRSRGKEGEK